MGTTQNCTGALALALRSGAPRSCGGREQQRQQRGQQQQRQQRVSGSRRSCALCVRRSRAPARPRMSYLLPHLRSGWAVDQAILAEEVRPARARLRRFSYTH
jgi:hypothetical protein